MGIWKRGRKVPVKFVVFPVVFPKKCFSFMLHTVSKQDNPRWDSKFVRTILYGTPTEHQTIYSDKWVTKFRTSSIFLGNNFGKINLECQIPNFSETFDLMPLVC